ncbi:MAG: hypothetical protein A2Z87_10155 [Gallionellales bacterium GWA2_54_124]|nr:MAG: hypothetical protein A2Z87_10155 [Gallionellales bacterium GWA2_54_124]
MFRNILFYLFSFQLKPRELKRNFPSIPPKGAHNIKVIKFIKDKYAIDHPTRSDELIYAAEEFIDASHSPDGSFSSVSFSRADGSIPLSFAP